MDGVLVDVSRSYRVAVRETVRFFTGKRLSLERIQALKNEFRINNDWEFSAKIIESLGKKAELKRVVEKFQEKYLGKKFRGLIGNEKLLVKKSALLQLGKKFDLLVFTGRPREEALFALRRFGIEGAFSRVVAMEGIPRNRQKPDPFGLKKILGENRNAFYAGDTLQDIECAKRAGICAIGVLPPQDKSRGLRKRMRQAGADFVLGDANEIAGVIG
jgi:HAD superfamily phosphatase